MATSYYWATGHVDASTTVAVSPQPKCEGIDDGAIKELGNGSEEYDGFKSAEWVFTALTAAQMSTLLTAAGLTTSKSGLITIKMPANNGRAVTSYQGFVIRPDFANEAKFQNGLWHNVVFKMTRLVAV